LSVVKKFKYRLRLADRRRLPNLKYKRTTNKTTGVSETCVSNDYTNPNTNAK